MGRDAGGWEVAHKMRHAATRFVFRNHFSGVFRRLNDRLLTKEVELRGTMHLAGRPMRRRVRGVMLRNDLANRAVHRRPPCRVL